MGKSGARFKKHTWLGWNKTWLVLGVIFLPFVLTSIVIGGSGLNFLPDQYEFDDTPSSASSIQLNAFAEQLRNFHKTDDEDWIQFHALKSDEAIEITVFDCGTQVTPVIDIYDTDATTDIEGEVGEEFQFNEVVYNKSFKPEKDGIFYAKISNKDGTQFGENANYSLRVGRPLGPQMGYVYGILSNEETGKAVSGALITTIVSSTVSSNIEEAKGFYSLPCPAGTFTVTIEKTGYETLKRDVEVGEAEGVELSVALSPAYAYSSKYELAQWGKRASDGYYCVDVCDAQTGIPYTGFQAVRCGDDFHAWSPKNYVNLVLGIPDSAASGFQFMWKVWSQSGYGGDGFEGVVQIP